ncbi:MAG: hypothetical protein CMB82_06125 [Flammeovirgaceae bacterium]|nr:hypothetical protein [Flammeovirgaceae bacterium]
MGKICLIIFAIFFFSELNAQKKESAILSAEQLQQIRAKATELHRDLDRVTPGKEAGPPSDAIVLFDGSSLDEWQKPFFEYSGSMAEYHERLPLLKGGPYVTRPADWKLENGALVVVPGTGHLVTKELFGDVQLHIEWLTPKDATKRGQDYSNSGLFFMGLYEIQILNSFDNETYSNGQAGAIYKQYIPLVNATKPPGNWQVYDIIFSAPKFSESGEILNPARITVLHNGVLIQNNVSLLGPTCYIGQSYYVKHPEKLPILLQDHGNPVRFRNIWARKL